MSSLTDDFDFEAALAACVKGERGAGPADRGRSARQQTDRGGLARDPCGEHGRRDRREQRLHLVGLPLLGLAHLLTAILSPDPVDLLLGCAQSEGC